jgi:ribonuclease P/MRP protein subunit RPP1
LSRQLEVDIITFDFSRKLPFYLKLPPVGVAIERGIFFEICYSPSLRDMSSRRFLVSNALQLVRATKGKNIIISSEVRRRRRRREGRGGGGGEGGGG